MKKYLSISAVICISLSLLSGCGGSGTSNTDNTDNTADNETTETVIGQNDDTEDLDEVENTEKPDDFKPTDISSSSENKQLSDGSTAYLDGNILKIVSNDEGEEFIVTYIFENNKLTVYSEIECVDEETAEAICNIYKAQEEQYNVYDVYSEGKNVYMKYNDQFTSAYSNYATAEQIYNALD